MTCCRCGKTNPDVLINGLCLTCVNADVQLSNATEIADLRTRLTAAEAERIGLVTRVVPDDEVHDFTRMSPKALPNFPAYSLVHHLVTCDELAGMDEEVMYYLRSLISKGKMTSAYAQVDNNTSSVETVEKTIYGPIAFFTSTTNEGLINDETRNRFLILPIDESSEQVAKVMQQMAFSRTKSGILRRGEQGKIFNKYKVMMKALAKVKPVLGDEWAEKIRYNSDRLANKRSFDGYLSLIEAATVLHQYRKQQFVITASTGGAQVARAQDAKYACDDALGGKTTCVPVEAREVTLVNKMFTRVFANRMRGLSPVDSKCLKDIVTLCKQRTEKIGLKYFEYAFTYREILDNPAFTWTPSALQRALRNLWNEEYLVRVSGRHRSRLYYKLNIEDDEAGFACESLDLWYPGKKGEAGE